jgi:hypothetical protein
MHLIIFHVMQYNRYQPLIVLDSVFYLQSTDLGDYRIRANNKEESICFLNAGIDFIQPFGSGRNILPVDPRLTVSGFQFLVYALSELDIFTRIGDEYVGHIVTLQQSY